jgi:hypothetical protein
MRPYQTPATRGSKEGKRRAALDRRERVEAYCQRNGLEIPATADGIRAILSAVTMEACRAMSEAATKPRLA